MEPFVGTLERCYALDGNHVLILRESYEGEIEIGDWVTVDSAEGDSSSSSSSKALRGRIKSIAWGSAFDAQSPPLTLVVEGLTHLPTANSAVRSSTPPTDATRS